MQKSDSAQLSYQAYVIQKALEHIGDFSPMWVLTLLAPSAFVAFTVSTQTNSPLALAWLAGIALYFLLSLSLRRRISNLTPGSAKLWIAIVISFIDGSVVASLVYFAPSVGVEIHALMAASLLVVMISGIGPASGYLPLYGAYCLPIIVAVLGLAAFGAPSGTEQVYGVIAGLGVLALVIALSVAHEVFGVFADAYASNLHNMGIVNKLKENVLTSEAANESKMRFLASASHDLRQPINALSMSIATLKLKKPDGCERIITRMDTAIESINSQLLGLLDISKLDAGIVELKPSPINLVELLKAVVDTSQQERDRIVPIFYSGPSEQITCKTDPVWLERIVRNLVNNAIKYTERGRIIVRLDEQPDQKAKITITDTGIGIARKNLDRVFDEFVQIDNPERDERKGLGLGLAIVKRTCALLDFKIELASVLGKGTSISIVVPTIHSVPFKTQKAASKQEFVSQNVLALDNDTSNLDGMRDLLEQLGHKVYAFESFKTAELCVSGTKIDMAFVDYRMPGTVQGVEAIRRFRQHNPRLKCFLVTGDGNIEEDMQDIEVIYKPVTMNKFMKAFGG